MNYYISDLHFGHEKVLEMSNRAFDSIEEHDNFIIDMWNKTVSNKDDIYIVGDIAYKNKIPVGEYLKKLKGQKHLIIGNHDLRWLNKEKNTKEYFESINKMTVVKDGKERIVLCHYPLAEWSGYFRGWYHVHGHIHNIKNSPSFEYLRNQEKALNAGVDINKFKPVILEELILNNKAFKLNATKA